MALKYNKRSIKPKPANNYAKVRKKKQRNTAAQPDLVAITPPGQQQAGKWADKLEPQKSNVKGPPFPFRHNQHLA